MTETGISVSELNQIIAGSLKREARLRDVTVTAEVSGFKHHTATGHWYFSLKDAGASISCVMFRQNNLRAGLMPKDGDLVTVSGYVELYARDGKVQLYAVGMQKAGTGSLYEQFEILKRRLSMEGLFDQGRKRILPLVPRKVAVITSASGAALHDVLNVSGQRFPAAPIVIVPSAVQGPNAGAELTAAIGMASGIPDVDVIIICRGGGSQEDLWCFNDEKLARAVAACPVPVVSGVGHEIDYTICDFAADVRASTPSNAAEIVFPDRAELRSRIETLDAGLKRAVQEQIHLRRLQLLETRDRLRQLSPEKVLRTLTDRTGQTRLRLVQAVQRRIRDEKAETDLLYERLNRATEQFLREKEHDLQNTKTRLNAISPLRVLDRGYALVYDGAEERLIPDTENANRETEMTIRFRDGSVRVQRKEQHGKSDF